jgi:aspartate/methionine/tyrosine aminotransferase
MRLSPFPLVNWFAEAEGRFDLSLGHSGCQPIKAADFVDEAELKTFADMLLGYGEFAGLGEFRQLIADEYETIDPADVLVFNGPSEAIYTFMQAMMQPGDHVIVQSPMFHTLHSIARQLGCEVREWKPTDELSYSFDVADLASLCHERTRLIVINFPHNPTGQMISEPELRGIVEIAQSVDALLFSDEVFRLLELPPTRMLPAACDLYDKAVSVCGLSKSFSLGGLRIGWLATKCDEVMSAVKQYRYYTAEMTNTPCQWLGCRALQRKAEILARNRALISANLDRLEAFAREHEGTLSLLRPQAGTMAVVTQHTGLTSTELCRRLLEEERLFLIPGKPLGMSDRLLRVGLGQNDFENGLMRLGTFLKRGNWAV